MLQREQSVAGWPTRRAQRCLACAVIFAVIMIYAICEKQAWSRTIELQLDSLTEEYSYGSSPEAGMPSLPFKDDSVRKSTEQPFFDLPYYEDTEQQGEVTS
ncbi:hypothetical protein LHYA1_G007876 [Lachnellula hyalina]|uniref:Uncharacterized protein n=1 Tax=Lachnellula hyalina TaxID=1316788 RepID=A0A8H8TWB8_9HELO|nr:uncharacterized protein LHYA1_G007876 [Lachnellula hyalina]TVY23140.1 hypothetical protein LHYA1_G007876 [Lachnellula hyalina]